jgi:carbonic anhydrase
MLTFDNAGLRGKVREELGAQAGAEAAGIDFLPFADVEQSVRDDVAELRASPLLARQVPVRGFVYDVRSGRITEVDAAPRR